MALSTDVVKLLLLPVMILACLSTLWTSSSIQFNNADFRVLSPQVQTYCRAPRQQTVKECEAAAAAPGAPPPSFDCQRLQTSLKQCESAVKKAYRDINIGGCPWEIKSLTLCENEWCRGSPNDASSCQTECAGVRESLTACIQRRVAVYFRRNRLKEDGTHAS